MKTEAEKVSKAMSDFDQVIQKYHQALREFIKGNPEPNKLIFSHRDDVTLANPLGPPKKGWKQVSETMDSAASLVRDGEVSDFDIISKYITPDLAFIVQIEWQKMRIGERKDITPASLRTTTIFRPEDGTWKAMHRQADPIVSARPPESIIQK